MNGMKKKKLMADYKKKFTEDGVPVDACDWTVDDWRDLFYAMEFTKKRIAKRHEDRRKEQIRELSEAIQ